MPVAVTSSGSSNMTYTSTPPRTYQYPSSSPPRDLKSGAITASRSSGAASSFARVSGVWNPWNRYVLIFALPGPDVPDAATQRAAPRTLRPPLTDSNTRHRQMLRAGVAATRRTKTGPGWPLPVLRRTICFAPLRGQGRPYEMACPAGRHPARALTLLQPSQLKIKQAPDQGSAGTAQPERLS